MYRVAPMEASDVRAVAALWQAYMTELFGVSGDMTADVFLREGLGQSFHTMVATAPNRGLVGAAEWWMTYDVHHAARGGQIPDMFVAPAHRGAGVAVLIIAAIAREVRAAGGVFLGGPATPQNAERLVRSGRLSGTAALVHVYWGDGLFKALADNAGADAKTLARSIAASKR